VSAATASYNDDDISAVGHSAENARQTGQVANRFAVGIGQHVLDIINRQSMLFDVFDVAARFFIPDDLLPHGPLSRLLRHYGNVLR
jgi:hypothetical protein